MGYWFQAPRQFGKLQLLSYIRSMEESYLLNYYSTQKWWNVFSKYCIYHTFFLDHIYLSK